jgi:hypothetical protein
LPHGPGERHAFWRGGEGDHDFWRHRRHDGFNGFNGFLGGVGEAAEPGPEPRRRRSSSPRRSSSM